MAVSTRMRSYRRRLHASLRRRSCRPSLPVLLDLVQDRVHSRNLVLVLLLCLMQSLFVGMLWSWMHEPSSGVRTLVACNVRFVGAHSYHITVNQTPAATGASDLIDNRIRGFLECQDKAPRSGVRLQLAVASFRYADEVPWFAGVCRAPGFARRVTRSNPAAAWDTDGEDIEREISDAGSLCRYAWAYEGTARRESGNIGTPAGAVDVPCLFEASYATAVTDHMGAFDFGDVLVGAGPPGVYSVYVAHYSGAGGSVSVLVADDSECVPGPAASSVFSGRYLRDGPRSGIGGDATVVDTAAIGGWLHESGIGLVLTSRLISFRLHGPDIAPTIVVVAPRDTQTGVVDRDGSLWGDTFVSSPAEPSDVGAAPLEVPRAPPLPEVGFGVLRLGATASVNATSHSAKLEARVRVCLQPGAPSGVLSPSDVHVLAFSSAEHLVAAVSPGSATYMQQACTYKPPGSSSEHASRRFGPVCGPRAFAAPEVVSPLADPRVVSRLPRLVFHVQSTPDQVRCVDIWRVRSTGRYESALWLGVYAAGSVVGFPGAVSAVSVGSAHDYVAVGDMASAVPGILSFRVRAEKARSMLPGGIGPWRDAFHRSVDASLGDAQHATDGIARAPASGHTLSYPMRSLHQLVPSVVVVVPVFASRVPSDWTSLPPAATDAHLDADDDGSPSTDASADVDGGSGGDGDGDGNADTTSASNSDTRRVVGISVVQTDIWAASAGKVMQLGPARLISDCRGRVNVYDKRWRGDRPVDAVLVQSVIWHLWRGVDGPAPRMWCLEAHAAACPSVPRVHRPLAFSSSGSTGANGCHVRTDVSGRFMLTGCLVDARAPPGLYALAFGVDGTWAQPIWLLVQEPPVVLSRVLVWHDGRPAWSRADESGVPTDAIGNVPVYTASATGAPAGGTHAAGLRVWSDQPPYDRTRIRFVFSGDDVLDGPVLTSALSRVVVSSTGVFVHGIAGVDTHGRVLSGPGTRTGGEYAPALDLVVDASPLLPASNDAMLRADKLSGVQTGSILFSNDRGALLEPEKWIQNPGSCAACMGVSVPVCIHFWDAGNMEDPRDPGTGGELPHDNGQTRNSYETGHLLSSVGTYGIRSGATSVCSRESTAEFAWDVYADLFSRSVDALGVMTSFVLSDDDRRREYAKEPVFPAIPGSIRVSELAIRAPQVDDQQSNDGVAGQQAAREGLLSVHSGAQGRVQRAPGGIVWTRGGSTVDGVTPGVPPLIDGPARLVLVSDSAVRVSVLVSDVLGQPQARAAVSCLTVRKPTPTDLYVFEPDDVRVPSDVVSGIHGDATTAEGVPMSDAAQAAGATIGGQRHGGSSIATPADGGIGTVDAEGANDANGVRHEEVVWVRDEHLSSSVVGAASRTHWMWFHAFVFSSSMPPSEHGTQAEPSGLFTDHGSRAGVQLLHALYNIDASEFAARGIMRWREARCSAVSPNGRATLDSGPLPLLPGTNDNSTVYGHFSLWVTVYPTPDPRGERSRAVLRDTVDSGLYPGVVVSPLMSVLVVRPTSRVGVMGKGSTQVTGATNAVHGHDSSGPDNPIRPRGGWVLDTRAMDSVKQCNLSEQRGTTVTIRVGTESGSGADGDVRCLVVSLWLDVATGLDQSRATASARSTRFSSGGQDAIGVEVIVLWSPRPDAGEHPDQANWILLGLAEASDALLANSTGSLDGDDWISVGVGRGLALAPSGTRLGTFRVTGYDHRLGVWLRSCDVVVRVDHSPLSLAVVAVYTDKRTNQTFSSAWGLGTSTVVPSLVTHDLVEGWSQSKWKSVSLWVGVVRKGCAIVNNTGGKNGGGSLDGGSDHDEDVTALGLHAGCRCYRAGGGLVLNQGVDSRPEQDGAERLVSVVPLMGVRLVAMVLDTSRRSGASGMWTSGGVSTVSSARGVVQFPDLRIMPYPLPARVRGHPDMNTWPWTPDGNNTEPLHVTFRLYGYDPASDSSRSGSSSGLTPDSLSGGLWSPVCAGVSTLARRETEPHTPANQSSTLDASQQPDEKWNTPAFGAVEVELEALSASYGASALLRASFLLDTEAAANVCGPAPRGDVRACAPVLVGRTALSIRDAENRNSSMHHQRDFAHQVLASVCCSRLRGGNTSAPVQCHPSVDAPGYAAARHHARDLVEQDLPEVAAVCVVLFATEVRVPELTARVLPWCIGWQGVVSATECASRSCGTPEPLGAAHQPLACVGSSDNANLVGHSIDDSLAAPVVVFLDGPVKTTVLCGSAEAVHLRLSRGSASLAGAAPIPVDTRVRCGWVPRTPHQIDGVYPVSLKPHLYGSDGLVDASGRVVVPVSARCRAGAGVWFVMQCIVRQPGKLVYDPAVVPALSPASSRGRSLFADWWVGASLDSTTALFSRRPVPGSEAGVPPRGTADQAFSVGPGPGPGPGPHDQRDDSYDDQQTHLDHRQPVAYPLIWDIPLSRKQGEVWLLDVLNPYQRALPFVVDSDVPEPFRHSPPRVRATDKGGSPVPGVVISARVSAIRVDGSINPAFVMYLANTTAVSDADGIAQFQSLSGFSGSQVPLAIMQPSGQLFTLEFSCASPARVRVYVGDQRIISAPGCVSGTAVPTAGCSVPWPFVVRDALHISLSSIRPFLWTWSSVRLVVAPACILVMMAGNSRWNRRSWTGAGIVCSFVYSAVVVVHVFALLLDPLYVYTAGGVAQRAVYFGETSTWGSLIVNLVSLGVGGALVAVGVLLPFVYTRETWLVWANVACCRRQTALASSLRAWRRQPLVWVRGLAGQPPPDLETEPMLEHRTSSMCLSSVLAMEDADTISACAIEMATRSEDVPDLPRSDQTDARLRDHISSIPHHSTRDVPTHDLHPGVNAALNRVAANVRRRRVGLFHVDAMTENGGDTGLYHDTWWMQENRQMLRLCKQVLLGGWEAPPACTARAGHCGADARERPHVHMPLRLASTTQTPLRISILGLVCIVGISGVCVAMVRAAFTIDSLTLSAVRTWNEINATVWSSLVVTTPPMTSASRNTFCADHGATGHCARSLGTVDMYTTVDYIGKFRWVMSVSAPYIKQAPAVLDAFLSVVLVSILVGILFAVSAWRSTRAIFDRHVHMLQAPAATTASAAAHARARTTHDMSISVPEWPMHGRSDLATAGLDTARVTRFVPLLAYRWTVGFSLTVVVVSTGICVALFLSQQPVILSGVLFAAVVPLVTRLVFLPVPVFPGPSFDVLIEREGAQTHLGSVAVYATTVVSVVVDRFCRVTAWIRRTEYAQHAYINRKRSRFHHVDFADLCIGCAFGLPRAVFTLFASSLRALWIYIAVPHILVPGDAGVSAIHAVTRQVAFVRHPVVLFACHRMQHVLVEGRTRETSRRRFLRRQSSDPRIGTAVPVSNTRAACRRSSNEQTLVLVSIVITKWLLAHDFPDGKTHAAGNSQPIYASVCSAWVAWKALNCSPPACEAPCRDAWFSSAFDMLDTDADGVLSAEDIAVVFSKLGIPALYPDVLNRLILQFSLCAHGNPRCTGHCSREFPTDNTRASCESESKISRARTSKEIHATQGDLSEDCMPPPPVPPRSTMIFGLSRDEFLAMLFRFSMHSSGSETALPAAVECVSDVLEIWQAACTALSVVHDNSIGDGDMLYINGNFVRMCDAFEVLVAMWHVSTDNKERMLCFSPSFICGAIDSDILALLLSKI